MGRTVRRVLTGHKENGKSFIWVDSDAPNRMEIEAMGGLTCTDLWVTNASPADNSGDRDLGDRPIQLEPPPNGSVFRVVDFPPDSSWKDGGDGREAFSAMGAGHAVGDDGDDPGMHITGTTDYAIVLEGEIDMLMDDEDVHLEAGDVIIQRGTNHAWSNRYDKLCRIAFILIDGVDGDGKKRSG